MANWIANIKKLFSCLHDQHHGRFTEMTAVSSKTAVIDTIEVPEQAQSLGYLSLGQKPLSDSPYRPNTQTTVKMASAIKVRSPIQYTASPISYSMSMVQGSRNAGQHKRVQQHLVTV